ncbi:class I SAM-dependent methyltransferase [Daejeonella oryzae]|uniref:class I SAM-dependent methyltransferase n=1 Tax=Daejeonella oryzae TaxID=1122943 RepID=UPI0003F8CA84|nr:RsmD family RNA methyltransferase [Daejeonella oryzae]
MNKSILKTGPQKFISENLGTEISRILFGKSAFEDVSTKELAEQIESKKRTEKKLPLWFNTRGIYFPQKLSIEQASSEITAKYKADLIRGSKVADLTGGFGIDSYYFSRKAQQVFHCEINTELSAIVKHNAEILGVDNITFIQGDGIQFIHKTDIEFDTLYIDPSRRLNSQKVFKLQDCEPDVPSNLESLLAKSLRIIIKTSPLLDLQSGLKELKNVKEIHIVSVKNDCKELLWVIEKGFSEEEPVILCAALETDNVQLYSFKISEEKSFSIGHFSAPLKFIYEPDVCLLKAGCFKLITRDFNILKLHQHTHLYTSEELNNTFIGRKFQLKKSWPYSEFMKKNTVKTANIITRNFPHQPADLKRKHKIKDGGSDYLIFTTGSENQLLVLNCDRL